MANRSSKAQSSFNNSRPAVGVRVATQRRPFSVSSHLLPIALSSAAQLNDIDAPFPALALGDESRGLSDLPSKLHLGQTNSFARLVEETK
jgi:hypothetical protein